MNPWILAFLLGVFGTVPAAAYTFVIGLGGVPGAVITNALTRQKEGPPPVLGLLLTALGQFLVSVVWVAAVYLSIRNWLAEADGVGRYVVWVVALSLANAPIGIALKDAAGEPNRNVQHHATNLSSICTFVSSVIFLVSPTLLNSSLGWVPHFGEVSPAAVESQETALPEGDPSALTKKLEDKYLETLDGWVANGGKSDAVQEEVVETCGKLVLLTASKTEAAGFLSNSRDEFDFRVDVCTKITANRIYKQPELESKELVTRVCNGGPVLFITLCKRSGLL